jgi:hypothetical protein
MDRGTHEDCDRAYVPVDDSTANATINAAGDTDSIGAPKSQHRKQRALGTRQQEHGNRQWVTNERLRVANEAARREADRMINAPSPMDWRNRYSSD